MTKSRISKKVLCNTCYVKNICLGKDLGLLDINLLSHIIKHIKYVKKKEQIYQINNPAKNVYAIYKGSCKEYWIDENGNEIIINFYFPGDIIGIESMSRQKYLFYLEALEDTQLCSIPMENLLKMMQQNTAVLKRVLAINNHKIEYTQMIRIGMTAKQKICDFLLNLSLRLIKINNRAKKFNLSMSQIDIANFLGMTPETVNRIFTSLKRKRIIKFEKKCFQILNRIELERLGRLDYTSELSPSLN